jgi:hypothetical protein
MVIGTDCRSSWTIDELILSFLGEELDLYAAFPPAPRVPTDIAETARETVRPRGAS